MLSGRRSLDGLEPHGVACCFNLRDATAARLIQAEREQRASVLLFDHPGDR
jgi:hypothetical protein